MLTAYGTIGLAAVGAAQTFVTRQAVRTTQEDVREARKARVDASAPRLTFIASGTSWPPHLIDSHDVTSRTDMNVKHRFVLPRDANTVVYVAGCLKVVNEGKTTAVVTIPMGAVVLGGPTDTEPARDYDAAQRLRTVQAFPLPPGEHVILWLRASRTAGEWAAVQGGLVGDQDPIVVTIYAEDTLADGVQDCTDLHIRAMPIVPSGQDDHAWVLNPLLPGQPSSPVQVTAAPTVRSYRSETQPRRHWWHNA